MKSRKRISEIAILIDSFLFEIDCKTAIMVKT